MENTTYRGASYTYVLLTKYYLGDQIENNEMDEECGTYKRQIECVCMWI